MKGSMSDIRSNFQVEEWTVTFYMQPALYIPNNGYTNIKFDIYQNCSLQCFTKLHLFVLLGADAVLCYGCTSYS